jgi:hypothetical protein
MKGGVEDVFTIAFLILLLGILGVVGWFFADSAFTSMESMPIPGGVNFTTAAPQVHQQATSTFSFLDGITAFVLVLMMGAALALAFYSRGRPFIAMITIFSQILYIIASYFIKIFWQGFSTATPALETVALTSFPITNLILTYMPFISFITLIGVIVLYFTKSNEEYAAGM